MAQPVTRGQQESNPESTKYTALDTLAIVAAWFFFFLMLFAVGTAVKSGL